MYFPNCFFVKVVLIELRALQNRKIEFEKCGNNKKTMPSWRGPSKEQRHNPTGIICYDSIWVRLSARHPPLQDGRDWLNVKSL